MARHESVSQPYREQTIVREIKRENRYPQSSAFTVKNSDISTEHVQT